MYKLLTANSDMSRLHLNDRFSHKGIFTTIWLISLMQLKLVHKLINQ